MPPVRPQLYFRTGPTGTRRAFGILLVIRSLPARKAVFYFLKPSPIRIPDSGKGLPDILEVKTKFENSTMGDLRLIVLEADALPVGPQ